MSDERKQFADFYRSHFGRLVLFLMHSGASLEEAQDAAQEAPEGS